MDNNNSFEIIQAWQQKQQIEKVLECNNDTVKFGLVLSEEEASRLMLSRKASLTDNQRVEFGEGILAKIMHYFCDSQYINQDNYADSLEQLQEIFYIYKNETEDRLTDDELLDFMSYQFEGVCFGDFDYLCGTCLERYARAIRSGEYDPRKSRLRDEYSLSDKENENNDLSEEESWQYEVYNMKLKRLPRILVILVVS